MIKRVARALIHKASILRGDIHRNDRLGGIHRAWGHIFSNHLSGDYVEFGVYTGDGVVSSLRSHAAFYKWLESQHSSTEPWRRKVAAQSPLNRNPIFHCLDTFEGMPENSEGAINYQTNTFLSDLEKVRKRIESQNSRGVEIQFYKGLFTDTSHALKENLKGRTIAIANIDCDLMQSTMDALDIIKDHIEIGTILLMDDYNTFNADMTKGQRKAISDFRQNSNLIIETFYSYGYSGQAFLVIGKF